MPNGRFIITEVNSFGEPTRPKVVLGLFKTVIRCLVRDHVAITYRNWRGRRDDMWVVPDNIKDLMWGKLVAKFEYPKRCNMTKVKCRALSKMAHRVQEFQG